MGKVQVLSIFIVICAVSGEFAHTTVTNSDGFKQNSTTFVNGSTLIINCNFNSVTDTVLPWNTTIAIEKIYLENCFLPQKPLVSTLTNLNITTANLTKLSYVIKDINQTKEILPKANYMEDLTIDSLEVASSKKNLLLLNPDFFQPLINLKSLKISGIDVLNLPTFENLSLDNTSLKYWSNCKELKKLTLKRINTERIPDWPSECGKLTSLKLEDMTESSVHYLATKINVSNLLELTIKASSLRDVPYKLLMSTKGLTHLDLSKNNLKDMSFSKFPILKNLQSLDLSHNKLSGWFLVDLPSKAPVIRVLTLDGNRFVHIFRYFQIKSAITQLTSLERLSMNKMLLDPDCLMSTEFSKLVYLSLASSEPIASLLLQSLPRTNSTHLVVDLRGRAVRSIPIVLSDFQDKKLLTPSQLWPNIKTNLTLLVSYVDCDCNNAELASILHDYPHFLSMPNLRCKKENGQEILQEPFEKLDCKKEKIGDCVRRSWEHNSVVDCSNLMAKNFNWDKMILDGVKGVNVSGNYISTLQGIDFGKLEWVDLRHNRVSRLENSELAQLFALRTRRVWLGGNIIICDCDNRALLRMLHSHHSQVPDYESLICADHNVPISSLAVARVCKLGEGFVYGICCAGSVLTVIIMILFRCCGGWLKTFMYARGVCIRCLEDKDPDADKIYDAFVAFSHGDEAFVIEQLLPRLELTPEPFRVCVHYRDWVVGEWIPAQIMRSIRSSKRTIIVFSKHLAESWWGTLEFRYAHAHAMSEGKSRLLVLVLDDVLEQKLDPELQGYLSTNTFLKHDDPWFWDKLHYAMSHNTVRYY